MQLVKEQLLGCPKLEYQVKTRSHPHQANLIFLFAFPLWHSTIRVERLLQQYSTIIMIILLSFLVTLSVVVDVF
jgi:hypothetical protein